MRIGELQELFCRSLRAADSSEELIDRHFLGDPRLSAAERLNIYRYAYWARQIEALRDEFRRLADRLGEKEFAQLMADYLKAHPSEDPCIERVGRHLEGFLRAHPDPRLRAHGDLAAFEWAEVDVLLAEEPPVVLDRLDVPAELFPECRLTYQPAWRLLALATNPLAPADTGDHLPVVVAVWRRRFSVRHRILDRDEHRAAAAVCAGATVAAVCEAFAQAADPARRAADTLLRWLSEGWLSRVVPPERDPQP